MGRKQLKQAVNAECCYQIATVPFTGIIGRFLIFLDGIKK